MANDAVGFDIPIGFNKADLKKSEADFNKFINDVNKGLDSIIKTNNEVESSLVNIKLPTGEINKLNNEFAQLQRTANQSINEQKNALAQLLITGKKGTKEFNDLEKSLKANIVEAKKMEKVLDEIEGTYDINLDVNADDAGKKLDKVKDKLKSFGKGAALGGIALIGAGLAGAVQQATEVEKAMSKVRALTGATGQEAEALKSAGKNLYTQGFGESLGETIEQVGRLKQSLGKVVEEKDFEKVSQILAGVANATGEELSVVGAKSRTFIQNFEGDAIEAANLIAFVSQNANNAQEDVLDTLDEYSGLVKQAGISSQDFAQFLVEGIEQGARNTDKLADGLKEAQIRILAGDYSSAFADLSKGLTGESGKITKEINTILKQAESGAISINDALALSGEKITAGVESGAISRDLADKLVVGIAGTPAEDVGTQLFAKLMSGLGNSENDAELTELGKKSAELYQKSMAGSIGGFAGLQRSVEVLLAEVGDSIMPVLSVVIEAIKQILPTLMPVITSVSELLAPVLVVIIDLLEKIMPTVSGLIQKLLPALIPIVELIGNLLNDLLIPLMPLLDILIDLALQILPPLIQIMVAWGSIISEVVGIVVKLASALYTKFYTVLRDLVSGIMSKFGGALDGISKAMGRLSKWIDKVFDKFRKWLGLSKDTTDATNTQTKSVNDLTDATNKNNEAIETNVKIGGLQTNSFNTGSIALGNYSKKTDDTTKSIRSLNEVLLSNTKLFDMQSKASQEFSDALRSESISDFAKIQAEQAESQAQKVDDIANQLEASLSSLANLDFGGAFANFNKLFEDFDISEIQASINDFDTSQLQSISTAFNSFAINTTKALASGEGGVKEGLKNLGLSVIDGLEAIIPTVVAKLVIEDTLKLGLVGGLLAGAGGSVALYALLEAARAGLTGAEGGGHITSSYNKKPGKNDDRLMAIQTGEFVVNKKAVETGDNLKTLIAMNNGEDLSNFAVNTLGEIVYGGTQHNTTINDYSNLEKAIYDLGDKLGKTKVEITDRGRIDIHDNRTVEYKKSGSYRG